MNNSMKQKPSMSYANLFIECPLGANISTRYHAACTAEDMYQVQNTSNFERCSRRPTCVVSLKRYNRMQEK